jgi:hypothetical protein
MPYEKLKLKVRLSGQFIYRIPVTHARLEGKSQCTCSMCVQRETNARPEKLQRNALQCTAENATLDFV